MATLPIIAMLSKTGAAAGAPKCPMELEYSGCQCHERDEENVREHDPIQVNGELELGWIVYEPLGNHSHNPRTEHDPSHSHDAEHNCSEGECDPCKPRCFGTAVFLEGLYISGDKGCGKGALGRKPAQEIWNAKSNKETRPRQGPHP